MKEEEFGKSEREKWKKRRDRDRKKVNIEDSIARIFICRSVLYDSFAQQKLKKKVKKKEM